MNKKEKETTIIEGYRILNSQMKIVANKKCEFVVLSSIADIKRCYKKIYAGVGAKYINLTVRQILNNE